MGGGKTFALTQMVRAPHTRWAIDRNDAQKKTLTRLAGRIEPKSEDIMRAHIATTIHKIPFFLKGDADPPSTQAKESDLDSSLSLSHLNIEEEGATEGIQKPIMTNWKITTGISATWHHEGRRANMWCE
jgi:hypothetical protein